MSSIYFKYRTRVDKKQPKNGGMNCYSIDKRPPNICLQLATVFFFCKDCGLSALTYQRNYHLFQANHTEVFNQ